MKPEPPLEPSKPVMARPSRGAPAVARGAAAGGMEERRLIARAQAGDRAAFRALVEAHRARAYALALRILRSAEDAEEVTQDSFVRAWTALPGFRGESSLATWVHRIVARRAFDRAQVMKHRRSHERADEHLPERASPERGDDDTLRAALLQRLVAALSPAQRAVVTLFYYEGQAVEQVAAVLGMPENTVKTHLLRARAALRAAWPAGVEEDA